MSVVYLKRQCQSLSQLFETLAVLYQYKCLFFNRGSPSLFLVVPLLRAEQLTWLLWCTYGCIFDCLLVICMICKCTTLGTSYNEQIDAKKTARCRRVLVVTKLFNIVVNDCDAKKSRPLHLDLWLGRRSRSNLRPLDLDLWLGRRSRSNPRPLDLDLWLGHRSRSNPRPLDLDSHSLDVSVTFVLKFVLGSTWSIYGDYRYSCYWRDRTKYMRTDISVIGVELV